MNLRQLGVPAAIVAVGYLLSLIAPSIPASYVPQLFLGLGLVAAVAVAVESSRQKGGASLAPILEALRAASRGKAPRVPADATGELAETFEAVGALAEKSGELDDATKQLETATKQLDSLKQQVKQLEANAGGSAVDVDALTEALERAKKGERTRAPSGSPGEVVALYGELASVAERIAAAEQDGRGHKSELNALADKLAAAEQEARSARNEIAQVRERLVVAEQEAKASRGEIAALSDRAATAEQEAKARKSDYVRDLADLVEAAMRAADGERVRAPSGATSEAARVYGELAALADRVVQAEAREKQRRAELQQAASAIEDGLPRLSDGVNQMLQVSEQATEHIRDMTTALANIAQSIETLASSAEESSSSILEMTATNDETAENVGELASSVRETVSSIEEMAYSIREVAKNVDALSLTAEETSSSMNEMDVSIDQVQSNANETARLSEEVATDAEKGAEAILKTIGEIYRIKESSQEAVAVISNLGFRIEAIGQILAVIDDVAEQTNLLALNAAIIAAQAGEHGKGFAVVADEIKDLAERAGGSTKEIAELIKTIQSESKNAIAAVERGAHNVDRGVEVSNEAERALKKILESSQKSTNMVRAIARATVEQAKGSKQVTDAIGRIAETVQQIAAATAEQARGSELIMKSAEKMRTITQHVERSSQEQARGGRQITTAIEQISQMVNNLNQAQRTNMRGGEQLLDAARRFEESARNQEQAVRQLVNITDRLRRALT
jgi:methyl-accepting chemotaxis protein